MRLKICSKCNKEKPLTEFFKRTDSSDGKNSKCKVCCGIETKEFKRTKYGLICTIYIEQKSSCKKRKMEFPSYSKQELIEWFNQQPNFDELYDKWVASGYVSEERPSIDRLDDYVSYTLDNIQLMTWGENRSKGDDERYAGINNKASSPVYQYDLNGNYITEWRSIAIAGRKLKINLSNISACCSFIRDVAGDFMWRYKEGESEPIYKIDAFVPKPSVNNKAIIQCDLNGSEIKEWKSLADIFQKLKLSKAKISECCNDKRDSFKNYIWKYKDPSNINKKRPSLEYYQYDLDNNFIQEWSSLAEIYHELGIDRGSIRKNCIGKQKKAGNFIWKYKHEVEKGE